MEWLIFGGAYLWREICISKLIGLALQLQGNLPFMFFFTSYPSTIPRGAYIWRGDLREGFLRYEFGGLYLEGLIHGRAYFWNFTVFD